MALKLLISLGVIVAILAAVTVWQAARNEARAEETHPPRGQFLDVDGQRVHARVMGDGPDLVLIHGASGSTRDMTFALAPALAERYRVIMFDRPGLGYSEPLPGGGTIAEQAGLLVRAARALGADRPIVMGQSYGGSVALAWAVHHPDALSALVPVAAPSHPWDSPLDPFYRVTSSTLGSLIVVPLISAYVSETRVADAVEEVFAPQSAPAGYADHFGPRLTLRRTTLRANALQRAGLLDEIRALHTRYDEITVPTEIVHGLADTTVGASIHSAKLVRDIPGAVLTTLPGIGHMPHQVALPQVVAAIDRAARRAGLRLAGTQ